ncbi:hypothetical protein Leryth_002093 [Lithospermum erythrorhizon]|nr:hypothetical protein Leryth_002093 [Lithospermum erythrorhizon]
MFQGLHKCSNSARLLQGGAESIDIVAEIVKKEWLLCANLMVPAALEVSKHGFSYERFLACKSASMARARIKKIMQADEDVGKIAMAVPVLVSKALELFLQDLCDRTYDITVQRGAKTVKRTVEIVMKKIRQKANKNRGRGRSDDQQRGNEPGGQQCSWEGYENSPEVDGTDPAVRTFDLNTGIDDTCDKTTMIATPSAVPAVAADAEQNS